MYFDSVREGEVLTVTPSGRLDAESAAELDQFLAVQDRQHPLFSLIFDFRETVYLSSAGLRTLTQSAKLTHARGGKLALFGLQPYCREVLRTAGFDRLLAVFDTAAEAYDFCGVTRLDAAAETGETSSDLEVASGSFSFTAAAESAGALVISGDIAAILHARLEAPLVHSLKLGELRWSLGYGALGAAMAEYLPRTGPLLTFDRAAFWTPAAERRAPDYLIPAGDPGEMTVPCGFNVSYREEFAEVLHFEATDPDGTELEAFWRDLLRLASRRRPGYKGIVWISALVEIGAVYLDTLKRAPLLEWTPANGKMISHPSNQGEWRECDALPLARNGVALLNGVGADLGRDLSDYSETLFARLFPLTPGEFGGRLTLTHNQAAVFDAAPPVFPVDDWTAAARTMMESGRLLAAGELQERSRIRRAMAGIGYIDALELPRQLDTVYARRLDYQLNRNQTLLRAYKALSRDS